ncbi:MAG: hypothetical protein AAF558_08050 [Verrucomicrobiota bacterium]
MKRLLVFILIFSGLGWDTVHAVRPNRIIIDSTEELSEGESKGVAIAEPGRLKPSYAADILHDFNDTILWDAVQVGSSGDLIIGTGPAGDVFHLRSSGQVESLTKFTESDVYAVAVSPKGEIYAASSPDGKIFKQNKRGKFEVWFEHGEKYVWDMLFDRKGRLYVATGQTGKLFRVDGKKKGKLIFDAAEPHLRCLAWGLDDDLIIGTTGSALLYRYRNGQPTVVLLDADRSDIAAVAVDENGVIYAVAVGSKTAPATTASTTHTDSDADLLALRGLISMSSSENGQITTTPAKKTSTIKSASKGKVVASEIYRIDEGLYPNVILKTAYEIHSMAWNDGGLLAGTGSGGRYLHVTETGEMTYLGDAESKQVTSILPNKSGGWFLLGSNWGKVLQLSSKKTVPGIYRSKVFDSKLFASWGRFVVHGQGKWKVRTRSGNTSNPDKSWYEWQSLKGEQVSSSQARYFQFEIELDRGNVDRIEFTYLPQNQPPAVSQVRVLEPNLGFLSLKQPPAAKPIQTLSQLIKAAKANKPKIVDRYRSVREPGLRTIVWDAKDPNHDKLRYSVWILREGQEWEQLARDLDQPIFSWDTSGWPDGSYYAKVVADDHLDNGPGKELFHEKVSEAWHIDHTAPELVLKQKSKTRVKVDVQDEGGVLQAVAVSKDGQQYHVAIPSDGILDSPEESFTFDRNPEKPLYIRAKDENGNVSGLHVPAE